jgi:hypothetical protein
MLSRHKYKHKLLSILSFNYGRTHLHALISQQDTSQAYMQGQLMLNVVAWQGNERGITVSKIDSPRALDEVRDY